MVLKTILKMILKLNNPIEFPSRKAFLLIPVVIHGVEPKRLQFHALSPDHQEAVLVGHRLGEKDVVGQGGPSLPRQGGQVEKVGCAVLPPAGEEDPSCSV